MATTVEAATLDVVITESITLNGANYGNAITKTFITQGKVDQRIMEITDVEEVFTTIIALSTVDSKGTMIVADWAYFRITNLDDTNHIVLQLYIDACKQSYHKVEAGESFLLMSPDMDVLCEEELPVLTDLTQINAQVADVEAPVEIEYTIITA